MCPHWGAASQQKPQSQGPLPPTTRVEAHDQRARSLVDRRDHKKKKKKRKKKKRKKEKKRKKKKKDKTRKKKKRKKTYKTNTDVKANEDRTDTLSEKTAEMSGKADG